MSRMTGRDFGETECGRKVVCNKFNCYEMRTRLAAPYSTFAVINKHTVNCLFNNMANGPSSFFVMVIRGA